MFGTFFKFETRFWLRGYLLWVFFLIPTVLVFAGSSTDIWNAALNTRHNAPWLVEFFYSRVGLLALLMTTAFMNSAATREQSCEMGPILFSLPIRKWPFLCGRYWGAALISIIPLLSVSVGNLAAGFAPWRDPSLWGATSWPAHLWGIVLFAIPNTLLVAAIIFSIAMLTRSTAASFVGGMLLLAGFVIAGSISGRLENQALAAMLDPFGIRTFAFVTRYWTIAQKNSMALAPGGLLLWNRVLWLGVGAVVFAAAGSRFSFAERARRVRAAAVGKDPLPVKLDPLPTTRARFTAGTAWSQFRAAVRIEFRSTVKSLVFLCLMGVALLTTVPALVSGAGEVLGNSSRPVTYHVIEILRGDLQLFIFAILTFFSGALVWKERDARCDEIHDAAPTRNWIPFAGKYVALMLAVACIEILCILAGVAVQAAHGYTRYEFGLYVSEILFWDLLRLSCYAAAAFLCHVVAPNKYAGYFLFILLTVLNAFGWKAIHVESHMLRFATEPGYVYSDMFGYGPYLQGLAWFTAYWWLFGILLALGTVLLWRRGKDTTLRYRIGQAGRNWRGSLRVATLVTAGLFVATASWAFYNTRMLHAPTGESGQKDRQAEYEKNYKRYATLAQPRAQSASYSVDFYPEKQELTLKGEQLLKNTSGHAIQEVHLNLARNFDTDVAIDRGKLKLDDRRLLYRIYEISPALEPGETIRMQFSVRTHGNGFENEVANPGIARNGSFVDSQIAPQVGYIPEFELVRADDRRQRRLPPQSLMPPLELNCTDNCQGGSDWVAVESVVSTSPDQIAVAPGRLVREWTSSGRRYFQYKLDRPALGRYSFLSARYKVAREDWNGVQMEVYYHPEHAWNVPRMMKSIRKSLEYYSAAFGPYPHKEARILEFPRTGQFAEAFPGAMPYSESLGFIADLRNPDDIDQVFYIVAHEMAHQWWGNAVGTARMQGATFVVESLAQYSALMVMEKEYGRDMMRKFLAAEMDRYLRGRGHEALKERPLLTVEWNQGYVHYDKGSVAMYRLKEMIGEEAVNRALRGIVQKYAYAPPPYPTSYVVLQALRAETPPHLQYLLTDLFEEITLFANRTLAASAAKRPDGRYDVALDVEVRKFKVDAGGNEVETSLDDYVEIGAFAAPAKGRKYGRTLHREQVKVAQARNRFTFTVDELPQQAGIDPFSLLIDRSSGDHLKKVDIR
jgi:ABC-2 type transport system permease protein